MFLATPAQEVGRTRSLEPLRIMKGMFLATMRGPDELEELYAFRPYDYGPFTREIYDDLDELAAAGLVAEESVSGRSWRTYRPTELGLERARQIADTAGPDALAALKDAYEFVVTRGFLKLLRDIYAEFPAYAVNTVVQDAAPSGR